jgi:K+ transporter
MMNKSSNKSLLKVGIIGSIVTAFCCFTPALAVLLGVTGLGALTGYLDYVLLPALCIFVIIIIYAVVQRQKSAKECCTPADNNE